MSNEKEYDAAGNLIKERPIYPSLWSSAWYYEPATIYGDYGGFEFEYDSAGNMTKLIRYSFYRGEEYGYSVSQVYEYEYI